MSRARWLSLVGVMLLIGCGPSAFDPTPRCVDVENPSQEIDACISDRVASAPAAAVTVADGDENDGP